MIKPLFGDHSAVHLKPRIVSRERGPEVDLCFSQARVLKCFKSYSFLGVFNINIKWAFIEYLGLALCKEQR